MVLVAITMVALLTIWAVWARGEAAKMHEADSEALPVHRVTHDSMTVTYTHDGEMIRWYVMTDPDYGVQYLVNDRGGCCVRLDGYGNVMGARNADES